MITSHIMGGLGNQLFQVFNLISYCLTNKVAFHFEPQKQEKEERPFYWDTFLRSLKPFIKAQPIYSVYREPHFHHKEIPPYSVIKNPFKIIGYFQSYKYFQHQEKQIFKLIRLEPQKVKIKTEYKDKYVFQNTISLHFRIGDYKQLQQHHPIIKIDYYENALEHICNTTLKIDWEILYFYEEQDINEVSMKINSLTEKFPQMTFTPIDIMIPDYKQMLLMSLCSHNIIANSSFSWWGAYFNSNPDKIVCHPSHEDWFGPAQGVKKLDDMFPIGWNEVLHKFNIYCLHYLLPGNELLEDPEFIDYLKSVKSGYRLLPTNHICLPILESIHYKVLCGTVQFSLYDKYVTRTNQKEHNTTIYKNLIRDFDMNKIDKIKIKKKYIDKKQLYVVQDGCHRLSVLLYNKYPNINQFILIS